MLTLYQSIACQNPAPAQLVLESHIKRPILKILVHIHILARPGKDLHMCLLEIHSRLSIASAADTNFTLGNRLVILLTAVCAVAFIAAGFYAASIKDNITAASAIDSCLPLPFMLSSKIFKQVTQFLLPFSNPELMLSSY